MSVSAIREITIGAGHLRRQVSFYGSAFGLRVTAKGRLPADLCATLWQHDDMLDAVVMARLDLLRGTRLRLLRTSGLPARPDFDVAVGGPLGIVWGAGNPRRTYYRLSGAGVEFHAPPGEDENEAALDSAPSVVPNSAPALYGRAVDGEYMIIDPHLDRGTPSRHFGVTEPLAVAVVVSRRTRCAAFLTDIFGWSHLGTIRRDDPETLRAMGFGPEQAHDVETFGRTDDPGAHLILLDFGHPESQAAQPPVRGIAALRVDCENLDATLDAARAAGALHVGGPVEVDDGALGSGRVATLLPPFGLLVELWESTAP